MAILGERIKTRRTALGWTQDTLAHKAGVSKSFLSDVENGKRSISADNLLDIARALGLSLDFLMKGEEGDQQVEPADVQIPKALAEFAADEGLSFRQALTLLDMQRQIIAHRSRTKRDDLEKVDWKAFYEAVKDFIK
jgi:y4mF family transcriptional regulator